MEENFKPHLFIKKVHSKQKFKIQGKPNNTGKNIPIRDRARHGENILGMLSRVWADFDEDQKKRKEQDLQTKGGEYITLKSAPNTTLQIESLDSSGSQLLNVRFIEETQQQIATIYTPEDKKDKLIKKVEKYSDLDLLSRFNNELVAKIEDLSRAKVRDLWSGAINFMPLEEANWVELWLSGGVKLFEEVKNDFNTLCRSLDIPIGLKHITFPERTILVVRVDMYQLEELVSSFEYIAELRKPEELNSFWLDSSLKVTEREDIINDALGRTIVNTTNNYISILDTGVNNGHLLIRPFLSDLNRLTANVNWGTNDVGGHGTKMAGVAVYGDLNSYLEGVEDKVINHQLESIKIIPPNGWNDDEFLPLVTQDAVNEGTINNPDLKRVYCFANTAKNQFEFGKPSTWSATIDRIIFGSDDGVKKIFIVSAGNIREEFDYKNYPVSNLNSQIESPAQSWNSISVGAYTNKILANNTTVANTNELSPFSRTSNAWESFWPIKPDVVFEGGNLIRRDDGGVEFHDDLEILTTSSNSAVNNLATINATSAATAFASNFIAKLRSFYPDAWEETLRALMIHSASWTDEMKTQMNFQPNTASKIQMLRTFGYGVPNLRKASECGSNYLTFISEEVIQPYFSNGKDSGTNDVHFYKFPWPKGILEGMGELGVTIRVTLSYFIEPNPGEKGYSTKYSYQSAALKFALMPPSDTPENFMLRINKAARDELKKNLGIVSKDKLPDGAVNKVKNISGQLGADNVFKGSVHSNYWNMLAAEAASCKYIAIYPQATGWWKNLKKQKKCNEKLRYSLVVSIETPENTQDIYTEIANRVKVQNLVKV